MDTEIRYANINNLQMEIVFVLLLLMKNKEVQLNETAPAAPSRRRRRKSSGKKIESHRTTLKSRFGTIDLVLSKEEHPKFQIQSPSGYMNVLVEILCQKASLSVQIAAKSDEDAGMHPYIHDLGTVLGEGFRVLMPSIYEKKDTVSAVWMEEDAVAQAIMRPGIFSFTNKPQVKTEDLFIKKDLPFQLIEEFLYHFARTMQLSIYLSLLNGGNAYRCGTAMVGAVALCLQKLRIGYQEK